MKNANRRRKQLQAYFAGIVDGEGSIGLYPIRLKSGTTQYYLKVQIKMTDPEVPGLLWVEYPEGLLEYVERPTANKERHANCWEFVLNGTKAQRFLKDTLPFLLIKQQQARLALTFLAEQGRWQTVAGQRGGAKIPIADRGEAYTRRCEALAGKIKALNATGPKGVNSVNALLGHGMREYRAKREDVEADVNVINQRMDDAHNGLKTRGFDTAHRQKLLEGVETRHRA